METRTQCSISKSKGARFSPTATSCQFDQLYLSQNFGVTISEAGKKIHSHSFVLMSCSSAMSECAVWRRCSKGRLVEVLGPVVLWYCITLAMSPAACSFGSLLSHPFLAAQWNC